MTKKGPFNDPIGVKSRRQSFPFQAPTKDQATTGTYMAPGDNYGTGFKAPVGKERASFKNTPIPQKAKRFDFNDPVDWQK